MRCSKLCCVDNGCWKMIKVNGKNEGSYCDYLLFNFDWEVLSYEY